LKPVLDLDDGNMLRPTTLADLAEMRALLHDAEVRRYLCDDEILPDDWIVETLAGSDALDARGLGLWAIQSAEAAFLGMVGLRPLGESGTSHPDLVGETQLTIAITPAAAGTGLARRASERLLRHGFEDLGLARVITIVDDPNERSHGLIQRLGFKRIGVDTGPAYPQTVYELRRD
jgi:[ribosomal protein S5]-alanine N-acetyltransferase